MRLLDSALAVLPRCLSPLDINGPSLNTRSTSRPPSPYFCSLGTPESVYSGLPQIQEVRVENRGVYVGVGVGVGGDGDRSARETDRKSVV